MTVEAFKFLFLELHDTRINRVLNELRCIFSGQKSHTDVHITLKGPQKEINVKNSIKKYKEDNSSILIHGVGKFSNKDSYVIYLKVECTDFRSYRLWRKPHYAGEYIPHITVYEGPNKSYADKIYNFLMKEDIKYECKNYDFQIYTKKKHKQYNLSLHSDKNLEDHEIELIKKAKKIAKSSYQSAVFQSA